MNRPSIIELIVVMLAALSPMFLMAGSIDYDEFMKSGAGLGFGGSVILIYRIWLSRGKEKNKTTAGKLRLPAAASRMIDRITL